MSAEESAQQLKLRVDRLRLPTAGLSVLSETNLDLVLDGLVARIASGQNGSNLSAVLDLVEESVRKSDTNN